MTYYGLATIASLLALLIYTFPGVKTRFQEIITFILGSVFVVFLTKFLVAFFTEG